MTDTNSLRTGAGYALRAGLYATHKAMIEAADTIDRLKNDAAIFYEAAAGLLATNDALRAQLAEAQRERDSLRKVVEFCKHKATGMRVWGGMGWVYHPPQAKRIYEAAEAALAATKTGEQHDNFCT